nr:hypothetical protein [Pseudomonadota bacterium]
MSRSVRSVLMALLLSAVSCTSSRQGIMGEGTDLGRALEKFFPVQEPDRVLKVAYEDLSPRLRGDIEKAVREKASNAKIEKMLPRIGREVFRLVNKDDDLTYESFVEAVPDWEKNMASMFSLSRGNQFALPRLVLNDIQNTCIVFHSERIRDARSLTAALLNVTPDMLPDHLPLSGEDLLLAVEAHEGPPGHCGQGSAIPLPGGLGYVPRHPLLVEAGADMAAVQYVAEERGPEVARRFLELRSLSALLMVLGGYRGGANPAFMRAIASPGFALG